MKPETRESFEATFAAIMAARHPGTVWSVDFDATDDPPKRDEPEQGGSEG